MKVILRVRRGTAAQWISINRILKLAEFGVETDTNKLKIGDGSTVWTSLPYISAGAGSTDIAALIHVAASKTTPVDADEVGITDSATSFTLKRLTMANLKAFIKTYLDGTGIAKLTTARTINGVSFNGTANISNRLDQLAVPTANVSMNNNALTNVDDPTGVQDAATKNYVDTTTATFIDASNLVTTALAQFGKLMVPVVYSSGWPALDAGLTANASVGFHFIGGDVAHPPPSTSGPRLWDRPV